MFQTKQQSDFATYIQEHLQEKKLPRRGDKELLELYSRSPWLRSATDKISFKTASVGWKLYVNRNSNGDPVQNAKLKRASFDKRQKIIKQDEDLEEITEHPLLDALDDMNEQMIGLQGRQITQTYLDLIGKVYWLKERNSQGMPINLYPLNPEWVKRNEAGTGYWVTLPGGWTGTVPYEDIVMFNDPDPVNPYSEGVGLGNSLDDEIATDEMASRYTKNFFYNSARPDILVYGDMKRNDAERLKADWRNKLRGFKNAYEPYFMPSGDRLEVQELSQSFNDMELVDLRKFERNTIIQVFGIPPEVLGIIENSNRATIDTADTIMAKYVIIPRLELQRAVLQQRLVPDYDDRLVLDYDNPVPEDKEYKKELMKNHQWAFSKNEIRMAAGEEPVDDGDVYNIPINSVITEQPENVPDVQENSKKKVVKVSENIVDEVERSINKEQIRNETSQLYQTILASVGQDALDQLESDLRFNTNDPYIDDYIEGRIGRRIEYINETTRKQLADTLIEGINQGESIPTLANRVSEVFDNAKNVRAETIARTETMSSVNGATFAGYKQSNVVEEKEWIATQDSRVRPHHISMDGQTVRLDAMFTSGLGNQTQHPGLFGIPEEDINCRCTIAPITKHDSRSRYADEEKRYKYWKTMDAKAGGYERAMIAAYKRAFQAQQNAVMDVLKSKSGG